MRGFRFSGFRGFGVSGFRGFGVSGFRGFGVLGSGFRGFQVLGVGADGEVCKGKAPKQYEVTSFGFAPGYALGTFTCFLLAFKRIMFRDIFQKGLRGHPRPP